MKQKSKHKTQSQKDSTIATAITSQEGYGRSNEGVCSQQLGEKLSDNNPKNIQKSNEDKFEKHIGLIKGRDGWYSNCPDEWNERDRRIFQLGRKQTQDEKLSEEWIKRKLYEKYNEDLKRECDKLIKYYEQARKQERAKLLDEVKRMINLEIDCYRNNAEKYTADCFKLFKSKLTNLQEEKNGNNSKKLL